MTTHTRKARIASLAVLGVLTTVGVGYAATIPGSDGTISACYATTNVRIAGVQHTKGDVRIVAAGEACRAYEKAIDWNRSAPAVPPKVTVRSSEFTESSSHDVRCLPGERATGGGFSTAAATNLSAPTHDGNFPVQAGEVPNGWIVGFPGNEKHFGAAYVICEAP